MIRGKGLISLFSCDFLGRKYVVDPSTQGGSPYGQSYGGNQYGQSSPYGGGAPSPYAASPYGGAPSASQQPSLYSPGSFPSQSSVYAPAAPSPNVYNPTAAFDNSAPYSQLNGPSQYKHNFLILIVRSFIQNHRRVLLLDQSRSTGLWKVSWRLQVGMILLQSAIKFQ